MNELIIISGIAFGMFSFRMMEKWQATRKRKREYNEMVMRRTKAMNDLYNAIISASTEILIGLIHNPESNDLTVIECIKELRRRAVIV